MISGVNDVIETSWNEIGNIVIVTQNLFPVLAFLDSVHFVRRRH